MIMNGKLTEWLAPVRGCIDGVETGAFAGEVTLAGSGNDGSHIGINQVVSIRARRREHLQNGLACILISWRIHRVVTNDGVAVVQVEMAVGGLNGIEVAAKMRA